MIQKSGKVITGFRIDEPRVESFRGRGFDTVVREQKADDPIANRAPEPSEGEQSWPCKDIYDLSILWEETFVLGIAGYHCNIARDHRPSIVPDAEEVLLYQRYGFALGCGSSFVRDA
jgi:hypothetical protein